MPTCEHITVYAEPDRFAGWPANNGAWTWDGREILVGYATGGYAVQPGHNIVPPIALRFARSVDGGETWEAEAPEGFTGEGGAPQDPPGGIDFGAPGFALRVMGVGYHGCEDPRGRFYYSLDRGRRWQGPYTLGALPDAPELRGWELTPRTDYVVYGPQDCLLLLSARPRDHFGSDRVFCARTTDGGATFHFLSWVVPPEDPYRAVMPCTVRLDVLPTDRGAPGPLFAGPGDAALERRGPKRTEEPHGPDVRPLVTAIRRREPGTERCWIDAYLSRDDGASWSLLSYVGDTGIANGNPPALLRLADGRLCCVYGNRTRRQMVARVSGQGSGQDARSTGAWGGQDARSTDLPGATWGPERILRDGYSSLEDDEDFGYPRLVQRADGRLVAMYYWASARRPTQHIAATIWERE